MACGPGAQEVISSVKVKNRRIQNKKHKRALISDARRCTERSGDK